MNNSSLAVLLTCFNRRCSTIACLEALYEQSGIENIGVSVFLVDDASSDGTSDAVSAQFPDVHLLQGNGHLFWNGGMRMAFAKALEGSFDFYLWLNDDTLLYTDALSRLFDTHYMLKLRGFDIAIVSGATRDQMTGETTYGGVVRCDAIRRLRFRCLQSSNVPLRCDTINGNCVLLPQSVVERTGNLSAEFSHYLGDFDYGLRACQQGCSVWLAAGHVATCESSKTLRKNSSQSDFRTNLRSLSTPKGLSIKGTDLTPIREWRVFCQRHGGWLWPLYWLLPYRRLFGLRFKPLADSTM